MTARLEHDAEREREQDEQQHERDRHAEATAARRLRRARDGQRRDPRHATARRVAREHLFGRQADCARVRLQEAAHEDLAGQLVELIGFDTGHAVHGHACRARNLFDAHLPLLAAATQKLTDGFHGRRYFSFASNAAAFSSSGRALDQAEHTARGPLRASSVRPSRTASRAPARERILEPFAARLVGFHGARIGLDGRGRRLLAARRRARAGSCRRRSLAGRRRCAGGPRWTGRGRPFPR